MRTSWMAALTLVLLSASPGFAQRTDGSGVPYRVWDLDGGGGIFVAEAADTSGGDPDYESWDGAWVGYVDVGRYWNSHLKTSVGLQSATRMWWSGQETVTLAGGQEATAWISGETRQTQVVLSGTWQFLDNTFAHPYVSGGARIGFLQFDSHRPPYAQAFVNGAWRSFTIPPVERTWNTVRARPFVAVGSKAYFNERTFVRPEFMLAFNSRGVGQWGLRLGVGVDF